jgi:hypothetical protein
VLNPSYITRPYYPERLLRELRLQSVGSRTVWITPEKWNRRAAPSRVSTTEIFVAGRRKAFRHLSQLVRELDADSKEAEELARIEQFAAVNPADRIIDPCLSITRFFEAGVHMLDESYADIKRAFLDFSLQLGVHVHEAQGLTVGGMWFVPVECDRSTIPRLAEFAFVRVIRPVPRTQAMHPALPRQLPTAACSLPEEDPVSTLPRVALLDGGLPAQHSLARWIAHTRVMNAAAVDDPAGPDHGLGVASAFLFGPIQPGQPAERPYSMVDSIRVLDDLPGEEDPLELYRTLGHIEAVLISHEYEFLNLSLGPNLPMEDNEVHAWTSVIDSHLSDGRTFMTVAAGNNGRSDRGMRLNRVQVPSDCVNAMAVGAANATGDLWQRAGYSAVGPGRRPGAIKPDVVAFGGEGGRYFHVVGAGAQPSLVAQLGTSFAAPYLLRSAVGIRALLGDDLQPLAIKALLIHAAHQTPGHFHRDVGWGKPPEDLMDIITCGPGVVRMVYQGHLTPEKYLRARLPLPARGLRGMVTLSATFCFASPTAPQDAASYTRAGLEITFRPSDEKRKAGTRPADTRSLFSPRKSTPGAEPRTGHGRWETVLHDSQRMRSSSLKNPAFDIHYYARQGGASARYAGSIPYALILTVNAPRCPDIYNDILKANGHALVQVLPKVALPVRA